MCMLSSIMIYPLFVKLIMPVIKLYKTYHISLKRQYQLIIRFHVNRSSCMFPHLYTSSPGMIRDKLFLVPDRQKIFVI